MSIQYPFITEKATMQIDESNKLHFIVDTRSNKIAIAKDIEKEYGFKVTRVHTMTTMKSKKKAIVSFEDTEAAHEIATRLGLL